MKKLKSRTKKPKKKVSCNSSRKRIPSEVEDVANAEEEASEAGQITTIEVEEVAILDTTKIKKVKVDKTNISKIIIEEGAEEVVVVEEAMMVKKRENIMVSEIQVLEDRIHSSEISNQKNS